MIKNIKIKLEAKNAVDIDAFLVDAFQKGLITKNETGKIVVIGRKKVALPGSQQVQRYHIKKMLGKRVGKEPEDHIEVIKQILKI